MSYERDHLRAIVAGFLASRDPVDGANEAREFCGGDWFEAQQATAEHVAKGLCQWADRAVHDNDVNQGSPYSLVVPTAIGIYEVLS